MDIQMQNADATNAADIAMLNAVTPVERAVAIMALWLSCRDEVQFENRMSGFYDESELVMHMVTQEMRQGSMNRVLQLLA